MIEEMEAYAAKALKIDKLEREVEKLKEMLVLVDTTHVTKVQAREWFSSISNEYAFLTDEGKKLVYEELGAK